MQGKIINGFELKKRLGVGGMAEVWYAENEIHKEAAVKILNAELSRNTNIVERFRNEAEIMVKLNHPNIRQVYGYGSIDDRPAIIMEYLDGDDLKARMKQGQRFTDEELVTWWDQLVDALNYTHKKGIVHRDIKPGNIFVDNEGDIKLLDFGIAKVRESISSTQTGQKLGTLMYMSPEQVKDSKHIDYHTDNYSLAVTFVHLITGRKPYDSDTSSDFEISEQIVYKPIDMSEIPEDWKEFLDPYLEKDPSKRAELKHFEVKKAEPEPKKPVVEEKPEIDEGTIIEGVGGAEEKKDKIEKQEPEEEKEEVVNEPKKKSKTWIWVCLILLAIIIIGILVKKGGSSSGTEYDPETEWYYNCRDVSDYREYIDYYGRNGKYYWEAKNFIDNYVADSLYNVRVAEEERLAQQQAENERLAAQKAENDKKSKEAAAAKKGYMDIIKIEFENQDYDGNVLTKIGNTLYESDIQYISAKVTYNGILDVDKEITVYYKIINSSGKLMTGSDSPNGYSWYSSMTVRKGKNNTYYLAGWGNSTAGSYYSADTYKFELWYEGNRIYQTKFTVYPEEELDYNIGTFEETIYLDNPLQKGNWRTTLKKCAENPTKTFSNGDSYKGELDFTTSKLGGLGLYIWKESDSYYVGSWKDQNMNGKGIYFSTEGTTLTDCPNAVYYVGGWSNGDFSGSARCYDSEGNCLYNGYFSNDKPTGTYPSNSSETSKYKFICDEYEGGDCYVGEKMNGSRHGLGLYMWSDGGYWYGPWSNGERDGYGIYIDHNGKITTGTWDGNTMK